MSTQQLALAAGVAAAGLCALKLCSAEEPAPAPEEAPPAGKAAVSLELHADQAEFLAAKAKEHGKGKWGEAKALRCLVDYLREASDADVKNVFVKKRCMRCGGGKNKAALPFELHPGQREFLEAQVGTKGGPKDISKAARCMLDWAMKDGEGKANAIWGKVRCLNCG